MKDALFYGASFFVKILFKEEKNILSGKINSIVANK
ncbi:hypothetical protein LMOSLCC2376_0104 [Listeria monocytogenes SLCC2376]|nr:hypothetical protein LMOSLCC2376_0104 [Listeria monocytogenes SLCC2376]